VNGWSGNLEGGVGGGWEREGMGKGGGGSKGGVGSWDGKGQGGNLEGGVGWEHGGEGRKEGPIVVCQHRVPLRADYNTRK